MSRHALLVATALLLLYFCVTPHLLLLCFNIYIIYAYIYSCFTSIYICICICCTPVCSLLNVYIHTYTLLVLYSCFTSRYMCNCFNPALLKYIYIYSCFTPTSRNVSWDAFLLQFSKRELFNNKDNDKTSKWPFVHYFFTQFLSY